MKYYIDNTNYNLNYLIDLIKNIKYSNKDKCLSIILLNELKYLLVENRNYKLNFIIDKYVNLYYDELKYLKIF